MLRTTLFNNRTYAAVLMLLGCIWTASSQAQLGSLIVNITEPSNGQTVSGTVTVRANVSIIGFLTVRGVQFRLDGANLGGEDGSSPYTVSWNTNNTSNGSHTLTAVARDILGIRYTSPAVTVNVSNAPPPDTTPPNVSVTSPASGSTVSGTISLSASASDNVGVAGVRFLVDGTAVGSEDTSAPYSIAWDTNAVANGSHSISARARDAAGNTRTSSPVTVTVSNAPPPDTTPPVVSISSPGNGATVSGTVNVSASAADNVGVAGVQFFVNGLAFGAEDTTAPYSVSWNTTAVSNGSHTLTALARDAAGNTRTSSPVTVTVSNSASTVTRFEETHSSVSYDGGWSTGDATFAWSGGTAAYSRGPDARATFVFTGTQISWIGWREARGGIARVFLDGSLVAEVDLYSASADISATVFTSAVLSSGTHTLEIEATGTGNPSAADTIVVIDAFDVTSDGAPPQTGDATRFEETSPAINYSGGWNFGESTYPWSGGTATYTVEAGAMATFPFTGRSVDWIGYRGRYGGIVRVYIDGSQVAELDTYSAVEQAQVVVYASPPLAPGNHTLIVELTELKNPAANTGETAVDAFDVRN